MFGVYFFLMLIFNNVFIVICILFFDLVILYVDNENIICIYSGKIM